MDMLAITSANELSHPKLKISTKEIMAMMIRRSYGVILWFPDAQLTAVEDVSGNDYAIIHERPLKHSQIWSQICFGG